jgi:hypothetical protein
MIRGLGQTAVRSVSESNDDKTPATKKLEKVFTLAKDKGMHVDEIMRVFTDDPSQKFISPDEFHDTLQKISPSLFNGMSEDEIEDLENLFDTRGDGRIQLSVLSTFCERAGEEERDDFEGPKRGISFNFEDEDEERSDRLSDEATFGPLWWTQEGMSHIYNGFRCQVGVAAMISLCFLNNAIECQIAPDGQYPGVFKKLELFWCVVFSAELAVNVYAHFFWEFVSSGWNWFDLLVVVVSIVGLAGPDLPAVNTLRLMRAFRVFRLFKRLKSLRKILNGLERAIPGVANAFSVSNNLFRRVFRRLL